MAKAAQRQAKDVKVESQGLLEHSHLAKDATEQGFHEFEFALHHVTEAFARWSSALYEYVSGMTLPVQDVSVLQLIRMNEKPKSATEIARFLNREDSSNILYTLRKLEKAGLIEKTQAPLRQMAYQVTEIGRHLTDRYARERSEILLPNVVGDREDLDPAIQTLWRLAGIYDQSAKNVAVMGMLKGDVQEDLPPKPARKPSTRKARSLA
jgi:predicted MarR family transcription regulator